MANNLIRIEPFDELMRFEPFGNLAGLYQSLRPLPVRSEIDMVSMIRMDLLETETAYTVKAEIPGVKKEDIEIDIDRDQVAIQARFGQREEDNSGARMIHSERKYGQHYRRLTLAHEVDESGVDARYQDGILTLTLPKKNKHDQTSIPVH